MKPKTLMPFAIAFWLTLGSWIGLNVSAQDGSRVEWSIRSDGTLLKGGQAWFPNGNYHVSWIEERYGKDRQRDVERLINTHHNCVHLSVIRGVAGQDDLFSTMTKQSAYVFAELYWPDRASTVRRYQSHPVIAAWNIADDVNWPPDAPHVTPTQLSVRHKEFKSLSPRHLTFVAGLPTGFKMSDYRDAVDVWGTESYPIGNEADDVALISHHRWCRQTREAFEGSSTTWILLPQTFAWKDGRHPSAAELRNMVYAGLMEGAKGIIGYAFYDGGDSLPTRSPECWQAAQTLTAEINALAEILCDGELSRPPTNSDHVHAGLWNHGGSHYLAIINTHGSESQPIRIPAEGIEGWNISPHFDSMPEHVEWRKGMIVGSLDAGDTQLYRLDPPS